MQDQSKSGADFVWLYFRRSLESDLRSSPSGEGLGLLSRLVIERAILSMVVFEQDGASLRSRHHQG